MSEDWPVRPADRLFYAREKAELEQMLSEEADATKGPALYLLRPPIVLGPHAVGGKDILPPRWRRRVGRARSTWPPAPPDPAPDVPIQAIHEDDVGQALLKCVLGEGPPGAYNIAATTS